MTSLARRLSRAARREYASALTLTVGVAAALVWSAASPSTYFALDADHLAWRPADFLEVGTAHDLVVNGLMAVFFAAVGLELSREMTRGVLTTRAHAVSPVVGALGGMAATALCSVALGHLLGRGALVRGWGVPMATDVAFSLGVVALVGRRLPPALRTFLLTLAIADDVASVVVLTVTGTTHPRPVGLAVLALVVAAGTPLVRRLDRAGPAVALVGATWLGFAWANVDPALAGVLAGGLVNTGSPWCDRLEQRATLLSATFVLPLFALVAGGVAWRDLSGPTTLSLVLATVAIRLVGKVAGITGGVGLARLAGYRPHPSLSTRLVGGVAVVCAIGFTVPLLFAGTLFGSASATYAALDLGLLASSVVAALLGAWLLHRSARSLG